MKVYIVCYDFDESSGNIEVFDSKEKAEKCIEECKEKKVGREGMYFHIEECEVR